MIIDIIFTSFTLYSLFAPLSFPSTREPSPSPQIYCLHGKHRATCPGKIEFTSGVMEFGINRISRKPLEGELSCPLPLELQ